MTLFQIVFRKLKPLRLNFVMKHFKHGLQMSHLSESQVRRLMTQVYACFPKVIKKQTPQVKPSAVAANVKPSRIRWPHKQPPAPQNLVQFNVSSPKLSDMSPQLVKLTPVITSMQFADAIALADSAAAFVRKQYGKGDNKLFLVDSLPQHAKIRNRLESMIKTMVHKMNATLEPVIEKFQMGFCREGSSVAKQR